MWSRLAAGVSLSLALTACGGQPTPRQAHSPTATPRPTTPACTRSLPAAIAGFRLGRSTRSAGRDSFGHAGLRCTEAGYQWVADADRAGGTCSHAPMSVGRDAVVHVTQCDRERPSPTGGAICAITLQWTLGGEAALEESMQAALDELISRYGQGHEEPDRLRPCPRVEGNLFGCVLDGVGIFSWVWNVDDPNDSTDTCDAGSGQIHLSIEGDRGTHDAVVTVDYSEAAARAPRTPAGRL